MGAVIEFARSTASAADQDDPHMSGRAVCMNCRHEWEAVAPVGVTCFECPACGLHKGAMRDPCFPVGGSVCVCQCGNELFVVERQGILCAHCGTRQLFEDVYP